MTDSATDAVGGLNDVLDRIASAAKLAGRDSGEVTLVAVSKTFDADAIRPVLEAGHRVFGENRVQEAQGKWPGLKDEFGGVELHLIGPLQSNKTKEAVALFDVIESVDREKIAKTLAQEIDRFTSETDKPAPRLLVQVNTGAEPQKAGVLPEETKDFVTRCREVHGLDIEGLMCIPPFDEPPGPHFALLAKLAGELDLKTISMGMSGDFEDAVMLGATHVRVGSAIFGARPKPA
ncbi:MAG: YggS family pyridoxal phosphate-dependent enzyme [Tepidamorphaceae bacterium]|nr:YggS family pyridoxal phosphate-dependent enzyme [Rhodobiaceae bacterium]MCC0049295.1 YggS family pyridoxal phosphate-dependent enzyme [Rhodobiaceae bacterium]